VRGAQPGRDQRGVRDGGPGAPPPNAPSTFGEGRRGPQAVAPGPSTSGAAPSGRERGERELRNRPPQGAASPQEPRGRERSGIESQSPRNQSLGGERGATQRATPAAPPQRPSAAERGPSLGVVAPRSRAPAAGGPRPQSPTTTGAAPGGGHAVPGGGRAAPGGGGPARGAALVDPLRAIEARMAALDRAVALRPPPERRRGRMPSPQCELAGVACSSLQWRAPYKNGNGREWVPGSQGLKEAGFVEGQNVQVDC
jgi:hypothetical protein